MREHWRRTLHVSHRTKVLNTYIKENQRNKSKDNVHAPVRLRRGPSDIVPLGAGIAYRASMRAAMVIDTIQAASLSSEVNALSVILSDIHRFLQSLELLFHPPGAS